MRQHSLIITLTMVALTGILVGCQGLRVTERQDASGGSTLRFVSSSGTDSQATKLGSAGSTFRFRPFHQSSGQEDILTAMEAGSAADSGATLRFR